MKSYPLSETSGSGVWSNSGLAKIAQTVKEKSLETCVHESNKQDSIRKHGNRLTFQSKNTNAFIYLVTTHKSGY